MMGLVTGDGVENSLPIEHIYNQYEFSDKTVTSEQKHENKSCSPCPKDHHKHLTLI